MDIGDAFRAVDLSVPGSPIEACYHPYKNLKHTWRLRNERLSFRISDYLKQAPSCIATSLAWFLVCRARGVECPNRYVSQYLTHVRSSEFWEANRSLYLSRARNLSFHPHGIAHDLREAFEHVNGQYFRGEAPAPSLAWANEASTRRMGYVHSPLRIVAVNKALDSHVVPEYVVEFVVYHELLHCILGSAEFGSRRVHHTREFRKKEREFERHAEAQNLLTRMLVTSGGDPGRIEVVPQV